MQVTYVNSTDSLTYLGSVQKMKLIPIINKTGIEIIRRLAVAAIPPNNTFACYPRADPTQGKLVCYFLCVLSPCLQF